MQIVRFIMTRDGYAYESPSFANGYTPLIAPSPLSSAIRVDFLDISSPFFSFLSSSSPTFEFHAIVMTYSNPRVSRERRDRKRRDILVDIGLLIFRDNVA